MTSPLSCPLCGNLAVLPPMPIYQRTFFKCLCCELLFVDPKNYLTREEEKSRYEEHNNDIHDPRYQDFVRPIFDLIVQNFSFDKKGLDFGAGTGPVLSHLLKKAGYQITLYDPFFWPNPAALEFSYDFVFATEVVEHFFRPKEEFSLLSSLTKGRLFLMTLLYSEKTDLISWYYLRDPTHVCAYSKKTFRWIQKFFQFDSLQIEGDRMVVLIK